MYQRNRKHLNWLPKCVDEEVPPSQPTPEMVSILPQSSRSDLTSMIYQTRSGRVIRAPTRYRDSDLRGRCGGLNSYRVLCNLCM